MQISRLSAPIVIKHLPSFSMPEDPSLRQDPGDQPAIARPDGGPVTVVSWQAEVNSVLPPPQAIEAYERSIKNAGERLLRLVENESVHRHELE